MSNHVTHSFRTRRATPDDWQAVYDMDRNVYNGKDHLSCQATFRHMMTRSYNVPYVVTADDGQVVSFMMVTIIDNERSVHGRFGRTHYNFRGKNLVGFAVVPMFKEALSKLRHKDPVEFVWPRITEGRTLPPAHFTGSTITAIKPRASYDFISSDNLVPRIASYARIHHRELQRDLVVLTDEQKRYVLSNAEISRRLFHEDRVTIDLMTYKTIPENYDIIMENEDPHMLAELDNQGKYLSVSFGTKYDLYGSLKLRYKIDIYAKTIHEASNHLFLQIRHAATINPRRSIAFIVCIDDVFTEVTKRHVFLVSKELGLIETPYQGKIAPYQIVGRHDVLGIKKHKMGSML